MNVKSNLIKSENLKLHLRIYNNLNSASSISSVSDSDSDISSLGDDSIHHTDNQLQCSNYVVDDSIVKVVDMSSKVPKNRSPKRKPPSSQSCVSTNVHEPSKYKPVQATETTNSAPSCKKKVNCAW